VLLESIETPLRKLPTVAELRFALRFGPNVLMEEKITYSLLIDYWISVRATSVKPLQLKIQFRKRFKSVGRLIEHRYLLLKLTLRIDPFMQLNCCGGLTKFNQVFLEKVALKSNDMI